MKGAIFDLDGTLIDSMGIWLEIDREFFAKRGRAVPDGYQKTIAHLGFQECAQYTVREYCPNERAEDLIEEWRSASLQKYAAKDSARYMKPQASEFLHKLKGEGIHLCVATASRPELYEPILKNNRLYDLFECFTTVDEVKKNKSFPDIFLKSAEKMFVLPDECVVFEDSYVALRCAKSVGMRTVAVFDESAAEVVDRLREYSDRFIRGFNELL